MTRPWWDDSRARATLTDGVPVLLPGGRKATIAALRKRIAGYVPEWRDLTEEDAGVALVRLFGLQLEPIIARLERLPEKALIEFLRAAGLNLAPPRSARTFVVFTPDERNPGPVDVPPGTKLLSARADGQKGDVSWETDAPLTVPNLSLAERHAFDGEIALAVTNDETFAALGERPRVGAAFYLGFTGSGQITGQLSMVIDPASDGTPAPVAQGGAPGPARPTPQLRWEALTDRGFQPLQVVADTTDTLTRTGIVTVALPRALTPGRPTVLGDGASAYWLRLRLAGGRLDPAPRLRAIHVHAVTATAKETFRDEFPILERDGDTVKVQLARRPVLSGSIVLEVDEGAASADLFELEGTDSDDSTDSGFRRWQEVATLAGKHPDARVFVLDATSGEIRFGNPRERRAPPPGIRVLAVRSYATTLGAAGNVAADQITRQPARIAGISSVTNPFPASGGAATEDAETAIVSGPATLKARGRAVSSSDMALLAQRTEGADILKAYALSGMDPAFPGALRPGTVGVFVVPRRHPSQPTDTPPIASSQTLGAVAGHLAFAVGPVGARVVAASPRYEEVRVEATLSIVAGADPAVAESAVRAALDAWLNPETGDWRIGATVRHADLTHVVLDAHESVAAVPFLALALDGIGYPACADVPLRRFSLPWPGRHRLVIEALS
ncbi:MAG TPA: putative baseplate assembly protein [Gammaproteobacteria bacterium]|nr:putative baseplate assembly protein [Gammaproteobacteria bacterium]